MNDEPLHDSQKSDMFTSKCLKTLFYIFIRKKVKFVDDAKWRLDGKEENITRKMTLRRCVSARNLRVRMRWAWFSAEFMWKWKSFFLSTKSSNQMRYSVANKVNHWTNGSSQNTNNLIYFLLLRSSNELQKSSFTSKISFGFISLYLVEWSKYCCFRSI